jgi:nucleoside-diphosphate-sugar epimerase
MAQTVLVTGASGFIAAHVIEALLAAGFKVRGTVRSESTALKVRKAHAKHAEVLSFAIVPDISAPNAFDKAVRGVDGVIHTASPFVLSAKDYDSELFEPAVNGTVSVLKAVKANNPSVRRIVITSSFAANLDFSAGLRPGYAYTEADWNPVTIDEARKADPTTAYLVSKTLAEKAAFDFVETEHPNFTIATLTPPMVYGPLASDFESMSKLNTSSGDIYRLFNGTEKEVPETGFWGYVDVRDRKLQPLRWMYLCFY